MENKKFNFKNYSKDLYEVEKESQKKLVETYFLSFNYRTRSV